MKLFVCLHNQLGAISRLRYLSESASHLLSLLVSESIFQLPLPTFGVCLYVCLFVYDGTSLLGRTWVWNAPQGEAAPRAVSAAPRMRGPGGSRGALAATIDPHQPAGQGAGLATGGLAGHSGDAFLPECPPC